MIRHAVNASNLNKLINSPDIRPFAGDYNNTYLDFTETMDKTSHIFLEGEGAGIIFCPLQNNDYEVHVFFDKKTRGIEAEKIGNDCLSIIFGKYKAKNIKARIPVDNKRAHYYAAHMGFTNTGLGSYEINGVSYISKNYNLNEKEWEKCPQQQQS